MHFFSKGSDRNFSKGMGEESKQVNNFQLRNMLIICNYNAQMTIAYFIFLIGTGGREIETESVRWRKEKWPQRQ